MGTSASSVNLHHGFPTPGPQTPTGQKVMDHVFFLSNEGWKKAREEGNFDFVVIGTGFCCLAFIERVLKQDPHCRVLVIERGPFFLPEHFQNLPLPFVNTLGGMSETFPWTLSATTASGQGGTVRWQHGMVPFFGGRSTLWSAWCPRPTVEEMAGWPSETIEVVKQYFPEAEKLLHVQKASEIDASLDNMTQKFVCRNRPVYGALQQRVQTLLKDHGTSIKGIYRTEAAPLASAAEDIDGIDFQKFSTPGEILAIATSQAELARQDKGSPLSIVAECVVEKIIQQEGCATALQTSRGILALGNAKLILATGTLPPTTLISNSFPQATQIGKRFSAHFITAIVARVPKQDLDPKVEFGELELSACYVAGIGKDYQQQYHIQLTALWDEDPSKNAGIALRYMPDVVATASRTQLESSKGYVVFVCAVLGELDYRNPNNWFLPNQQDTDITTNSLLQVTENQNDAETWDAMDKATFDVLEKVLSPQGDKQVEYWHGTSDFGHWDIERPSEKQRRVDALVHESSTLHLGIDETAPVDLNYRLKGTKNVFITGGGLWPQGGSWNPTMTMVALTQHLADLLLQNTQSKKEQS
jgi:choline dehydrogenase-like flavoprotein